MAPLSNKRAYAQGASTEAKKAKVADPIVEKVDLVTKTISQLECQLQSSHKEMLLQAIPHVLPVPSDERHDYQTQVAQMMQKVLTDYVAYWEQQVSESKANIGMSSQKAEDAMKVVEASAAKIEEQNEEVTKCKSAVHDNSEATKAAEEALHFASKEVAEFDEKLQETIAQKDKCSSIYNESFVVLKNGGSDAKEVTRLLNQVQPMLKKLSTESSLLSAITPAFKKPLADRGPFDIMAIEGAEGIFMKHLEGLQEQIDKADETKADKLSTETASQDTLKDAKEKYTASEDALKAAEEVLASLEAKHLELLVACNAASEASNTAEAVVATKEASHKDVQLAFGAFTELFERQSSTPESAADVNIVEDKLEAVCESRPCVAVA